MIKVWRANNAIRFNSSGEFKQLTYLAPDPEAKVLQIQEICAKFNIDPTETIFVGGSLNDLDAFELTKHGIFYNSKNKVLSGEHDKDLSQFAWKTIAHLKEIETLLDQDNAIIYP